MNNHYDNLFSSLMGMGLVVIASRRLAWAITLLGSLVWVFVLTGLCLCLAEPLLPKKGRVFVTLFMASFWGSLYAFMLQLLDPFLAADLFFLLMAVPLYYSGLRYRTAEDSRADAGETVIEALQAAAVPAFAAIILSVIREPLGYGALTLPGGRGGITPLFAFAPPAAIMATNSGALILLAYVCVLYRITAGARE